METFAAIIQSKKMHVHAVCNVFIALSSTKQETGQILSWLNLLSKFFDLTEVTYTALYSVKATNKTSVDSHT